MTALAWVSLFSNTFITRSDFMTDFRTRVDEDDTDSGIISDTQLVRLIYHGLNNINQMTGLLPEYAEVAADGSAYYTLPSGFTKLRSVYHISSAGVYTLLDNASDAQIAINSSGNSTPQYCYRLGNRIYVQPYGINTGTIRAYGSRIPTTPSASSTNIDLPQEYVELLFLWCEWKYFRRRRVPDEAQLAMEMYVGMCKDVSREIEAYYVQGGVLYGSRT